MSVNNGDKATAENFNGAFLSRKQSSNTVGKIDLENVDAASGASIINIQRELNALNSFLGKLINQAQDASPGWSTDDIGSANDPVKTRIEAVIAAVLGQDNLILNNQTAINEILAEGLFWEKVTVGFAQLSDPSTSFNFNAYVLPIRGVIHGVRLDLTEQFAATGLTDLRLSVGPDGDDELFVSQFDGLQAVDSESWDFRDYRHFGPLDAGEQIVLKAQSTGANLDGLSAGTVNLYFLKSQLPE